MKGFLGWFSAIGGGAIYLLQLALFCVVDLVLIVFECGAKLAAGLDRWFDKQANRNRLFRRLLLVWACGLITWVVWLTFTKPPDIPGSTGAALTAVLGLLTVVIGFYQWSRASEDAKQRSKDDGKP